MTAWAQSLIRISNYEVETLQKRLAEITARRASAEMRHGRARRRGRGRAANAPVRTPTPVMLLQRLSQRLEGCRKIRRPEGDVAEMLDAEEVGARDALTGAFEELKKFEHVAETTRLNQLVAIAKRETAAFDELGLRKRAV